METLRPLQVGEIIDRAVSYWRRHLWSLFRLVLAFQIVGYGAGKALEFALRRYAPLLLDSPQLLEASRRGLSVEQARQIAIGTAAFFAYTGFIIVASWIANVIVSTFTLSELTAKKVTASEAALRPVRRGGALLSVLVVGHLWALGAYVLAMLPGVLLFGAFFLLITAVPVLSYVALVLAVIAFTLGTIFIFLWYVLRFMLAPAVIAVEGGGGLQAFRRSGKLVSGRVGPGFGNRQFIRATLVLTVMFAVVLVVSIVPGLPSLIVQSVYGGLFEKGGGDPTKVPQLLLIPTELFEVFCSSLLIPLTYVLSSVFYLDARMRREGVDLEVRLEALAEKTRSAA